MYVCTLIDRILKKPAKKMVFGLTRLGFNNSQGIEFEVEARVEALRSGVLPRRQPWVPQYEAPKLGFLKYLLLMIQILHELMCHLASALNVA